MLGVDYSFPSVRLARNIDQQRVQHQYQASLPDGYDTDKDMLPVTFQPYDILKPTNVPGMLSGGFDVLLDKGTFDAISLSSDADDNGKRVSESYCDRIKPLLRDNGLFVVTSCNWTEDELKAWFVKETDSKGGAFVLKDRIKYRTFSFGGKTGQSVVTLCFQKQVKS
jgi:EEF1A lysine methyltransferase 2